MAGSESLGLARRARSRVLSIVVGIEVRGGRRKWLICGWRWSRSGATPVPKRDRLVPERDHLGGGEKGRGGLRRGWGWSRKGATKKGCVEGVDLVGGGAGGGALAGGDQVASGEAVECGLDFGSGDVSRRRDRAGACGYGVMGSGLGPGGQEL